MYEPSSRSPGVQFALGMDQLAQALDTLADVDFAEVDGHSLGERALELMSGERRLSAIQAVVTERFAASGAWVDAGAKSARAWIASQTNEPVGRVGAVINTGKGMRSHEEMAQAFIDGEVSSRHMDLLAAAGAKYPKLRGTLYSYADAIVEVARYTPPARFAQELEALCHQFDPAAVEKDEHKRDSEAYVHLSPIGEGMWRMDGLLPAEVGIQFAAVLDAARRRLRAEAKEARERGEAMNDESGEDTGDSAPEGCDVEGEDVPFSLTNPETQSEVVGIDVFGQPVYADETPVQARDNRFGSRQNIDALRLMLNLVAPAKNPDGTIALPSVNGARPVVHLTVDIESLLEESENKAAAWLERFGVPHTVISATKAALLACDATIEPMIMRDGQLVATLPSLQTVPAHLRKAVIQRDRQCRINSCTSPIDEVHHLIFLSQGGPTVMSNLAGLCWFHHHLIHHGNWTLLGDANAEITLTNTTTGEQWTNRAPRNVVERNFAKRKRE